MSNPFREIRIGRLAAQAEQQKEDARRRQNELLAKQVRRQAYLRYDGLVMSVLCELVHELRPGGVVRGLSADSDGSFFGWFIEEYQHIYHVKCDGNLGAASAFGGEMTSTVWVALLFDLSERPVGFRCTVYPLRDDRYKQEKSHSGETKELTRADLIRVLALLV